MNDLKSFRQPFIILITAAIAVTLSGCRQPAEEVRKSGMVEANYIEYRVEYLEKRAGDIPTSLLPDKMQAYYTRDYILTRIDGYFGQFSLVQVAHLRKRSVITMLNFFGTKVYYVGERNEIPVGIVPINDPQIEFSDETIEIAGLRSFRASVSLPEERYDIYYTKDFNVRSPNITTPYHFIDHVLCDFRVQLSYLKMRLIMEDHNTTEIDYDFFGIPEDYTRVSRAAMENIINSLFTKE